MGIPIQLKNKRRMEENRKCKAKMAGDLYVTVEKKLFRNLWIELKCYLLRLNLNKIINNKEIVDTFERCQLTKICSVQFLTLPWGFSPAENYSIVWTNWVFMWGCILCLISVLCWLNTLHSTTIGQGMLANCDQVLAKLPPLTG